MDSFNSCYQPLILPERKLEPLSMLEIVVDERALDGKADSSTYPQRYPSMAPCTLEWREKPANMSPKKVKLPFPWKLHQLLDDLERIGRQDIASWLPGGSSFRVHKPDSFQKDIMRHYFRQTKFASFVRQLYIYGFSKIESGPEVGGYQHPSFLRDNRSLTLELGRNQCEEDRRCKPKKQAKNKAAENATRKKITTSPIQPAIPEVERTPSPLLSTPKRTPIVEVLLAKGATNRGISQTSGNGSLKMETFMKDRQERLSQVMMKPRRRYSLSDAVRNILREELHVAKPLQSGLDENHAWPSKRADQIPRVVQSINKLNFDWDEMIPDLDLEPRPIEEMIPPMRTMLLNEST